VRGRSSTSGLTSSERARVAIGADGRRSRLARRVGAELLEHSPPLTCWYFSYWEGVPHPPYGPTLEIFQRPGTVLFCFPTNDRMFAVFAGWSAARLDAVRSDPARAIDSRSSRSRQWSRACVRRCARARNTPASFISRARECSLRKCFFNVDTLGELLGDDAPHAALAGLAAREARRITLAA
jgi:2-polyprenyl-6-methoxyphenol hydroxylase-like FAD-dependent oxidoreductase